MKNIHRLNAIALGLLLSTGVLAETMSKDAYEAAGKRIDEQATAAKDRCGELSGNANDICVALAKGNGAVAHADLNSEYAPSVASRHDAHIARADATYAVAKERCDDKAGNTKDVCEKEAEAAKVRAVADADVQMKTSKADAKAVEKTMAATETANDKTVAANVAATRDKNDADYAVAKAKCDVLAGDAKDQCSTNARARFDKN